MRARTKVAAGLLAWFGLGGAVPAAVTVGAVLDAAPTDLEIAAPGDLAAAVAAPVAARALTGPYAALFLASGARHGVSPALLSAIGWCESRYTPDAVSPAGATGLMQIMPGTAAELGVDPLDPADAIDGAARYLARASDQMQTTDPALMAAAYNAGPGAVARYNGVPPYAETEHYVACVTGRLA